MSGTKQDYTRRIAAQIPIIREIAKKGNPEQRKVAEDWLALCTPEELALAENVTAEEVQVEVERAERGEA